MAIRFILVFAFLFATAALAGAQDVPTSQNDAATQPDGTVSSDGPVVLPEPSELAVKFYRSGIAVWLFRIFWAIFVPALILFTGLGAKIRTVAKKLGRFWYAEVAITWVLFMVVLFVFDLPLSYYVEFVRQHAYGLSNQDFAKWLRDSLTNLAVTAVIGVLFIWVPYLLLKKAPNKWWILTGILACPYIVLMALIYPIWIDPLFNKFGPMEDKALESKILTLAERSGIEGSRVYEVNKSIDTKTVNAYVTGFMDTKRIVLWDTTLQKLDESQILVIMAHEMGHYVLRHVVKGIALSSILVIVGLYIAHKAAGGIINRYQDRIGFTSLADPASLALLLLLVQVISLVLTPIGLAYSRHIEHEADRFALELTQDNHAAASAFVALYQENLGYPRPAAWIKVMRSSHPPLADRVDFCNTYRPWETGQAMKYADLFNPENESR